MSKHQAQDSVSTDLEDENQAESVKLKIDDVYQTINFCIGEKNDE